MSTHSLLSYSRCGHLDLALQDVALVTLKLVMKGNCDHYEFLLLRHAMSKNLEQFHVTKGSNFEDKKLRPSLLR